MMRDRPPGYHGELPPGTQHDIRGLGDVIEIATKAIGIKSVVDRVAKVTGKDCGCKKRKELLNKKFPLKEND